MRLKSLLAVIRRLLPPRRRSPASPSKGGLPNVRRPKRIHFPLPLSGDPAGGGRKRSSARPRLPQASATRDALSIPGRGLRRFLDKVLQHDFLLMVWNVPAIEI